jgi:hypothetical protein
MIRHPTAAPLALTAVLLLVSSTGYAQYTYKKTRDQSASQSHMQTPSEQSRQAAQQQVTGQVQRTKNVEVRTLDQKGQAKQNRVVLLQTEQGRRVVVDLGPTPVWQRISLKPGAQLSASGQ